MFFVSQQTKNYHEYILSQKRSFVNFHNGLPVCVYRVRVNRYVIVLV